jgi:hypothetical protein
MNRKTESLPTLNRFSMHIVQQYYTKKAPKDEKKTGQ